MYLICFVRSILEMNLLWFVDVEISGHFPKLIVNTSLSTYGEPERENSIFIWNRSILFIDNDSTILGLKIK